MSRGDCVKAKDESYKVFHSSLELMLEKFFGGYCGYTEIHLLWGHTPNRPVLVLPEVSSNHDNPLGFVCAFPP